MIPPPSAVIMPKVTTPTMSSRAIRNAVSEPLSAKANVPVRSRTSSNGASVVIPRFYHGLGRVTPSSAGHRPLLVSSAWRPGVA